MIGKKSAGTVGPRAFFAGSYGTSIVTVCRRAGVAEFSSLDYWLCTRSICDGMGAGKPAADSDSRMVRLPSK